MNSLTATWENSQKAKTKRESLERSKVIGMKSNVFNYSKGMKDKQISIGKQMKYVVPFLSPK